jgi:hypothetical protein
LLFALLKLPPKFVTFQQKCATHRNNLSRYVSFWLYRARLGAVFSTLEKLGAAARYFFAMETTAIIHRRYMPGIVMLTH